ncbi:MAG: hypothetical protein QNI91_17930 [Arenicellales bacterium]|nr:hypothetical protein [Arenicellales bacterium]
MELNSTKNIAAGVLFLCCVVAIFGFSSLANACAICVPYPTKTAADYLVESDTAVLARENPDKPWSYIPIEILKGETSLSPIDNFLNSTTRRLLEIYPERGVVFVQNTKDKTKWRSLGFADEEYEKMVREIIQRAPHWQQLGALNESRLAFFANYLGHKNRALHELAYLEIGRAPYGQIKQLDAKWPLDQIRALLRNPMYLEWHPLAILMLAHNGDVNDRANIIDKFSYYARFGLTTNLSAWTTALIEIEEDAAVVKIEEKYFRSSIRSREELVAVTAALSEHGSNGHTHLRDQIIQSYSTLLDYHPEMASYVARDLMTWRRWELSDQLGEILNDIKHNDPLNAYTIRLYLSQANKVKTSW